MQKRRLQPLWTFNEVVDALGGPVAVGRFTGQSCAAVCNWRSVSRLFPSKYYFAMQGRARGSTATSRRSRCWASTAQHENDNDQAA